MNTQNENENSQTLEGEEVIAPAGETIEQKAERLESSNKQLFARAKKAEGFEQVEGKWVKPAKSTTEQKTEATQTSKTAQETSSTEDLYALMGAKVPQEDIGEVKDYAKYKGISIAEALKSTVVVQLLADKAEKRNIAEATHTGGSRRTNGQVSDDALVINASNGKLPESDDDIARLAQARRDSKRPKK